MKYKTPPQSFLWLLLIGLVAMSSGCADQAEMAKLALEAEDRDARMEAVLWLHDQELLAKVAVEDGTWDVRKLAFGKLSKTSLDRLAVEAEDNAIKLAAEVKQGEKTWDDVFSNAHSQTGGLGDAVGAIALVGYQKSASSVVVTTCHKLICKGDTHRIPELIELLDLYGDKSLAEENGTAVAKSLSVLALRFSNFLS